MIQIQVICNLIKMTNPVKDKTIVTKIKNKDQTQKILTLIKYLL